MVLIDPNFQGKIFIFTRFIINSNSVTQKMKTQINAVLIPAPNWGRRAADNQINMIQISSRCKRLNSLKRSPAGSNYGKYSCNRSVSLMPHQIPAKPSINNSVTIKTPAAIIPPTKTRR